MQKIKHVLSVMLLIGCTLLFFGCASINSSLILFPDGKIQDKLIIELDLEKLYKAGVPAATVASAKHKIKEELNTRVVMRARKFVDIILSSDKFTTSEKQNIAKGIECELAEGGDNQIMVYTIYYSPAIFNLFNETMLGLENLDYYHNGDVIKTEKNLFSIKYVTSEALNCYSAIRNGDYNNIISQFTTLFGGQFSIKDVEFTQIFASPDTNLRSNANNTAVEQGVKFHEWNIDPNHLDFSLQFYKLRANEITWYILALVLTLIVGVVVIMLYRKYQGNAKLSDKGSDNNRT